MSLSRTSLHFLNLTRYIQTCDGDVSVQVAVDIDYNRSMFELHQRVNPKEAIIGWYVLSSPCS